MDLNTAFSHTIQLRLRIHGRRWPIRTKQHRHLSSSNPAMANPDCTAIYQYARLVWIHQPQAARSVRWVCPGSQNSSVTKRSRPHQNWRRSAFELKNSTERCCWDESARKTGSWYTREVKRRMPNMIRRQENWSWPLWNSAKTWDSIRRRLDVLIFHSEIAQSGHRFTAVQRTSQNRWPSLSQARSPHISYNFWKKIAGTLSITISSLEKAKRKP